MPNNKIVIMVGRFGGKVKKITVPTGSTVKEVLEKAGFDLSSSEKIWKGGERAKMTEKLSGSTILNVVGSYDGAFK